MKDISTNKILLLAIVAGLFFHFLALVSTFQNSYDAFVHMFFADHYMRSWFEPWESRWYTGFLMFSYPPLVHQIIAIFAFGLGLKSAYILTGVLGILIFTTGFYRFASYVTHSRNSGAYAALLAVFSTAIIEALHIFGQMPMLWGISLLLHALAEIYLWFRHGRIKNFAFSLLIMAVMVCSHHVTAMFGMVFFILPMISLAYQDTLIAEDKKLNIKNFFYIVWEKRTRLIVFGICALALIVLVIFPYWHWSTNNPISQESIPHGSRSNFLEDTNFGMVFFLIPWGSLILLLAYYLYRFSSKRLSFFGISFVFLFVLGLGGTTPIAETILGEYAFQILTLERFTFWAIMISLPIAGEFVHSFYNGKIGMLFRKSLGRTSYRFWRGSLLIIYFSAALITVLLSKFNPVQPDAVDMKPIVNFINQDEHDQWRYITLGFGDQMAWLSTQTAARTLDGNYHSARAIPELTSRPVERIENLKYSGNHGMQALEDFLSKAEKYHLKYCFSNDKFYDPILFYNGWQRVGRLENGIVIWQRAQITKLPSKLPKKVSSKFMNIMWGTLPMLLFISFLILYFIPLLSVQLLNKKNLNPTLYNTSKPTKRTVKIISITSVIIFVTLVFISFRFGYSQVSQHSPEHTLDTYFANLDLKNFKKAYSYFMPDDNFPIEQFMLEVHTQDGLLNSYSKLHSVEYRTLSEKKGYRQIEAISKWQTPLNWIEKTEIYRLKSKGGKWYILPEKYSTDIPEEPFFTGKNVSFYNHGRRENSITKNNFIESLDQPNLSLLEYNFTQEDSSIALHGMIKNTSNKPANIWVGLKVYTNHTLTSEHNTQRLIKYLLLPGETSPFSLTMDGVHSIADKSLSLFLNSEVSYEGIYPYTNALVTPNDAENAKLTIYNYGTDEVTVPRVLVALSDSTKRILEVKEHIPLNSIRPQRKLTDEISTKPNPNIKVIDHSIDEILINNTPIRYQKQSQNRSAVEVYINPFVGVIS